MAVLSLALGIAANTAVFSLVNEFLLRSLPVRDPERLVIFRNLEGMRGGMVAYNEGYGQKDEATGRYGTTSFTLLTLEHLRARTDVMEQVWGFAPFFQVNVLVNEEPDLSARVQMASGNYHLGLGVSPFIGRLLTPEDDRPGTEPVAVISYRFWQAHFEGSPAAIGRSIQVNKVPVTIIGVTPPAFTGSGQVGDYMDVTVPLAHFLRFQPEQANKAQPYYSWMRIMGRLAPGVTREQARATLEPIYQTTTEEGWNVALGLKLTSGEKPDLPNLILDPGAQGENDTRRQYTRSLRLMLGLVGLVLLAACANVANLLLARGAARRREIAVRLALGASRARIVRQLLAESLLLAGFAAALGIAFALWSRGALLALRPFGSSAVNFQLPLDWRVLLFTSAATVVTALVFGLAPALRATKLDLVQEFSGGNAAGARSRSLLSRCLMVVQIALSLLLLVSTGLLLRSLRNLQNVDPGFNRHGLAAFRIDARSAGYGSAQFVSLHQRIADKLATLPGVRAVTFSRVPLLSQVGMTATVSIPGFTPPPNLSMNVHLNGVAANFFSVVEMPLVLGRGFTHADAEGAPLVAVVKPDLCAPLFRRDQSHRTASHRQVC